jgi:hypothetical protein
MMVYRGFGECGFGNYEDLQLGLQAGNIAYSAASPFIIGAVGGPIGAAIGAAVAGVTLLISKVFAPDTDKIYTTDIVNAVEPYMKQNLQAYLSSGHTKSEQTQALANFDYLWAKVKEGCDPNRFHDAAVACIADRSPGGKWNWFAYYRDPIANDPNVKPDPGVVGTATSDIVAAVGDNGLLLLGLGLVAVGVMSL